MARPTFWSKHPRAAGRGPGPRFAPRVTGLEGRDAPAVLFVAATGSDAGAGTQASPFRSIQRAVNAAASGDEVRVAAGTYTYEPAQDRVFGLFGTTAVVNVVDKNVAVLGGYSAANWAAPDPAANVTVIDGQGLRRGVLVTATVPGSTGLRLEGFTVRNGVAVGNLARAADASFGLGGGLLAERSQLVVRDTLFRNNEARGTDTSTSRGGAGAGAGGGVAVFSATGQVLMDRVGFFQNVARGGPGAGRGGFGQGGGLFTDLSDLVGNGLTFTGNVAIAGVTTGSGLGADGFTGDAFGGGAQFVSGFVRLAGAVANGNRAVGGNAPFGSAGGGYGGAIAAAQAVLFAADAVFADNEALGANGAQPNPDPTNFALGGGIRLDQSGLLLQRSTVDGNRALGGGGQARRGGAGGGGVAADVFPNVAPRGFPQLEGGFGQQVIIQDTVVTNNRVTMGAGTSDQDGGGGGGVWLRGVDLSRLEHVTLARNVVSNAALLGQAVLLDRAAPPGGGPARGTSLSLTNAIIADHANGFGTAAVHLAGGNTAFFTNGLFANNTADTNAGAPGAGSFFGLSSVTPAATAGFVDAADGNFQLLANSPAVDPPSATQFFSPTDRLLRARVVRPDFGAFEFRRPQEQGVAAFDPATGTWYLRPVTGVGGAGDISFGFGAPGWKGFTGDFDADGVDTVGVFDPDGFWYVRNANSAGAPAVAPFQFGAGGWVPFAGDWDGNGTDTPGLFDPATGTWYLRNTFSAGAPDITPFVFGLPGWRPVVGDWDGNGTDTVGVLGVVGRWRLRNANSAGPADAGEFGFGLEGFTPFGGEWNGAGVL